MDLKGKPSAILVTVILIAGAAWYAITGGPGSEEGSGAVDKPYDAFEVSVSSVREDGSFRGQVEQSGRQAQKGLQQLGTYDRVRLRLADLEPPQPVRDPCWIDEGQRAVKDLIGARIWVDPADVEEQGSGTFTVYAWNRSGTFVQEQLLRDGDAKVFGGRLSVKYAKVLEDAEDDAAAAERGLWGACGEQ